MAIDYIKNNQVLVTKILIVAHLIILLLKQQNALFWTHDTPTASRLKELPVKMCHLLLQIVMQKQRADKE